MTLARGDVVTVILPGDLGKPRPAVVVQAEPFAETHATLTVCPLTTHLTGLRLFRISLAPDQGNGLARPSEVMVDKVSTLRRERMGGRIGRLALADMMAVSAALRVWLGVG